MLGKGNESNGWKARTSIMRALIARPPFRRGHSLDEWTVELAFDSEVLPSANGESAEANTLCEHETREMAASGIYETAFQTFRLQEPWTARPTVH